MKYLLIALIFGVLATLLAPYVDTACRKIWKYITIGYKTDETTREETKDVTD